MNSILPSFVWKVLGIGDVELRINIQEESISRMINGRKIELPQNFSNGNIYQKLQNLVFVVFTVFGATKIFPSCGQKMTPRLELKRCTLRSKTIFGNRKPFKHDEKGYLFHLKSYFRSPDI